MKISGMVRGKKKEKKGQEGGMTENVGKKKKSSNQPITHHTQADTQKHKNLHKPLIVTPHRNASITVCMAWRE